MALSYLLVYEPLEDFGKKQDYWFHYIKFYEEYWGGTSSLYGVFFGNDYNNFRKSLAGYLEIEEQKIEDCYFMKDETGKYYISLHNPPVDTYILTSKNHIPLHWFTLFESSEKKSFSTRLDFSRIHYTTRIKESIKRLSKGIKLIESLLDSDQRKNINNPSYEILQGIHNGLFELRKWLSNFNPQGFLILNYGELCSFTSPSFIKNENSVFELNEALDVLKARNIKSFEDKLMNLTKKWDELRTRISNRINTTNTIQ